MPLSLNTCLNALDTYFDGVTLTLVPLTDPPTNNAAGAVGGSALSTTAVSAGLWPTSDDWSSDASGAVATVTNTSAISFGAFAADIDNLYGIALLNDGVLVAWAPFVDASGAQVRRSFKAGDSITLPAGAFSVSLA